MKSTLTYSPNHPLPMQPNNLFTGVRKGLKMLVLPMLLLLLSQFDASAQTCALNCKQNIQVSLGANCRDTITYDIMTSCPGPASNYIVGIMRSTGLQVPAVITGADIGQTLTIKLKSLSPVNECWGTIKVEDKLAPRLTCPPNTTFYCGTRPDTTNTTRGTGRPTVLECSAFTLTFSDVNKSSNCLAPDTILRTFIATDAFGNVASCLQKIALIRPLVQNDSIKIKNDTFYGCALPMTSYVPPLTSCPFSTPLNAVTGVRDTIRFCRGNFCNINTDYSDIVDTLCSANTKKITRTWRILDACTATWVLKMQLILVLDTVPPVITMSGPDTIYSNTSYTACGAFLSIPPVLVTDACSSPVSVTATIYTPTCCSNPANIVGTVAVGSTPVIAPFLVPVDTHFIVYRATDLCGNFSTRSKVVIVRDLTPPVAICRTNTVVSLTSDTYSRVLASTFDEGSADNCCIGRFEVRRMTEDTTFFKPYIDFTCADASTSCTNPTPIQVVLRVYDCHGNYNTCMINVTVQDKVPPTISAPPSVTVDCGSYNFGQGLTNAYLATNFGKVVIAPTAPSQVLVNIFGDGTNNNVLVGLDGVANDNCSVTVAPTFTNNLNSCGVGTIVRTWVATDPCGRTATASQTITVRNSAPFNGNTDIVWPADFTTTLTNCTTVNTAPSVTGTPIITSDGCDQVLTTYEDEIFNILPNGNTQSVCYKILRTWVVVDWCQANIPGVTWRYTYSQAIKVIDTTVPVINNCPTSDILVDIQNSGCTKDALTLPTITATDCPNQTLTYNVTTNFPAGTGGTDNNDKTFFNVPVGTYTAQYSVSDNCGNVAACNVNIIVRDRKKPTPVCFVATTALMMPPACMVRLDTFHINNRSYDNCTGESNLRIRMQLAYQRPANPNYNPLLPVSSTNAPCLAPINPVPVSTNPLSLPTFVNIFPCDLVQGIANVRMYVIDQAGNFDYCETQVAVTNFNGCTPTSLTAANIAGLVQTEMGDNVEQASVRIDMANTLPFTTGANGAFNFNISNGGNYTVNAEKDMNPLNGVTTYDLVLMSRHILGIEQLGSPYRMIAADINKSGTITTLDMVELRKLILHIDNNFTNNTSWRFVDKSFVFPNPSNPFASPFPEAHSVTAANMNDAINFVGVKIGDVNATASANTLLGTEEHNAVGTLNFNVADKTLQAGENVTVDFRAKDLRNTQGFQFTLNFDANALTFADIKTGELNSLTRENFGTTMASEGVITSSWNGAATSVKDETVVFSLTFKVNHAIALSNAMHFNSRYTAAEAYNTQAELLDVNLQFNKSTGVVSANNFELYQNQPNPFNSKTTVGFNLPTAGDATLIIMDAAGRTLKTWTNGFAKGYNEFNINKSELDATGVLYYQLSTATNTATKKMIIIE